MKRIILSLLLCVGCGYAAAQDVIDLSGTWQLDVPFIRQLAVRAGAHIYLTYYAELVAKLMDEGVIG